MIEQDQKILLLNPLLFGDDMVLAAESAKQLQFLVTEFGRVCRGRRLRVNMDKCKFMVVGRKGVSP